ncbi:head-tail connector protein [Clostridium akagii]|uniref:head-tail connector protein n=1 Tax=Clostridium akagii TaxID=91623 RepID=UPI00047B0451|nr:head-tail connector protein [Clostridium akagii]
MNTEYNLKLVTPPVIEPLTLQEAQAYLRVEDITDDEENSYIQTLITAAREWCETYQHRAYITQTWEMSLKEFPCAREDSLNNYHIPNIIEIPKGNLQTINSINYKDIYGTEFNLVENVDYIASNSGILGKICPPYGTIFPYGPLWPLDPIIINFTCGYGDNATKVPQKVKQAMFMLISHWYDNRSIISELRSVDVTKEMAFAVTSLLKMDRITIL